MTTGRWAALLVVVLAVIAGLALRDRGAPAETPPPASSPTAIATGTAPGATTPAPTGTASPQVAPSQTPSQVLDERFGFVLYEPNGGAGFTRRLRSETSDTEVTSFRRQTVTNLAAVSPDGRSVAHWQRLPNGGDELQVYSIGAGTSRVALRTDADEIGAGIAWSSDGTGLVAGLVSDGPRPAIHASRLAEIWTIDVQTGAIEQIASRTDGYVWVPIAWDRGAKLVAAGVTQEGVLSFYELIDLGRRSSPACSPETPCPYEIRNTPLPPGPPAYLITGLEASPDARYVLVATEGRDTLWWPLAEPEKRSDLRTQAVGMGTVHWRPGTTEIWWLGGLTPAGCGSSFCTGGSELISYDVATGARTVRLRGEYGAYLSGFRVDGSAGITVSYGTWPVTRITVVDLTGGEAATVETGGVLGQMVRLR